LIKNLKNKGCPVKALPIVRSVVLACFCVAAAAQSVSSATYLIGGSAVPSHADASKTSVDIIDSDPLWNDPLATGLLGFIGKDSNGNWVTSNVNTVLFCEDGEVRGPAGGSGENPANVFVRVTFRDSNNRVLKVIDTGTKNIKCV
jgi:hypothetical protein